MTGLSAFDLTATVDPLAGIAVMLLLAYICTGIGLLWYWPVTLAFVSRQAPRAVTSLAVSASYVTLFIAGLATGTIGSFYEALTPAAFFLLNAAIPASGAVLLFAAGPILRRAAAAPSPIEWITEGQAT